MACRLNHHTGYGYYTNPIHTYEYTRNNICFLFFFSLSFSVVARVFHCLPKELSHCLLIPLASYQRSRPTAV